MTLTSTSGDYNTVPDYKTVAPYLLSIQVDQCRPLAQLMPQDHEGTQRMYFFAELPIEVHRRIIAHQQRFRSVQNERKRDMAIQAEIGAHLMRTHPLFKAAFGSDRGTTAVVKASAKDWTIANCNVMADSGYIPGSLQPRHRYIVLVVPRVRDYQIKMMAMGALSPDVVNSSLGLDAMADHVAQLAAEGGGGAAGARARAVTVT